MVVFRIIDDELGNCNNIEAISEKYRLTFDCVLNHVSKSSSYVQGHIDNNPDYINFCIEEDPSFDHSNVTRPRTTPLFHTYDSPKGEIKLWTTFSEDQVDLNFSNPNVLLEIVDVGANFAELGSIWVVFLNYSCCTACAGTPPPPFIYFIRFTTTSI